MFVVVRDGRSQCAQGEKECRREPSPKFNSPFVLLRFETVASWRMSQ